MIPPNDRSARAEEAAAYEAAAYEEALAEGSSTLDCAFEHNEPQVARTLRMLNTLFRDASGADNSAARSLESVPPIPAFIGRFPVERLLGQGGMGTVYLADDPTLARRVAIKVPRMDRVADLQSLRRLSREARAVAKLDHPGIVPVYEVGESAATGHALYLVLAACDGEDLGRWVNRQQERVDMRLAARVLVRVATAVEHGHQHGVLHCDLKPSNILLFPLEQETNDGDLPWTPRVTDFGLSQSLDRQLGDTGGSMVIGTPVYMSPEQAECRDDEVGVGTDVFAIGAILYELLTGAPPFAADTYPAVLKKLREERLQAPSELRPEIPRDLETICLRCLQHSPEDRYHSAAAVAGDLNHFLASEPILARPLSLWYRLKRWATRPSRVAELMLTVVIIVCVRATFGCIGLALLALLDETSMTQDEFREGALFYVLGTTPMELWVIWAARKNAKRQLADRWYWAALLTSAVVMVLTFLTALGVLSGSMWYQRMPGARTMSFLVIGLLFLVQTACWYIGDWNCIDHRDSRRRRTTIKRTLVAASLGLIVILTGLHFRSEQRFPAPIGPSNSITLDGVDDFVEIRDVAFAESQAFTLEAWIHPERAHRGTVVVYGPLGVSVLAAGDATRIRVEVSESIEDSVLVDTDVVIPIGQWAHVAVT